MNLRYSNKFNKQFNSCEYTPFTIINRNEVEFFVTNIKDK